MSESQSVYVYWSIVNFSVFVHRAALCDGVRHNFSRKGVVVAQGQGVSSERALELAIEAGAEDVQETEDEDDKSLLQVRRG